MKILLSLLSLFVLVQSFQYVPVFTGEQRLNLYTMEDKTRFKRLADLIVATCAVNLVSSTERAAITTQTNGVMGLFSFSFQMIKNNSLSLLQPVRPIKWQIWTTLVDLKISRVAELVSSFNEVMASTNENARETLGLNYCRDLKRFMAEVLVFYDQCETSLMENLYPHYTDQQLFDKSVEIIQLTTGYLQLKNAMVTNTAYTPKEMARFFQYAIGAYTPAQAQEIRDALQASMPPERYATFNTYAPQVPP